MSRLIRRPPPWILAVAACALLVGSVALAARNHPQARAATASDAAFTTLDGANVNVPTAGTATLVYFFAVDCGSCLQTATALAAAQHQVSGTVTYLAVDMDSDHLQDIRGFLHWAGDPSEQVITAGAGVLISRWQVTARTGAGVLLMALAVSAAAAGGLLARLLHRAVRYTPRAGGLILTASGGYLLLAELPRATGTGPAILDAGPLAARIATWVSAHQPTVAAVAVSLLGLSAVALTIRATRARGRRAPTESDRPLPDAATSDVTDAADWVRG